MYLRKMIFFKIILKNFLSYFLIIGLVYSSCHDKDTATISGTITNAKGKSLFLEKYNLGSIKIIDSITLKKNGIFRFKTKIDYPEFYNLRLDNKQFIPLVLNKSEKIILLSSYKSFFKDYTVEGSASSLAIRNLNNRLLQTQKNLDTISQAYKKVIEKENSENLKNELTSKYVKVIQEQQAFSTNFIKKNTYPMASYYALYQQINSQISIFDKVQDLLLFQIVATSFDRLHPDSPYTKSLIAEVNKNKRLKTNLKLKKLISESESTFPELELIDDKGNIKKLSDLKNKTVLLAFWSFKNKNSIKTNLEYKKIYDIYKNKGFRIFHVNVDNNVILWEDALKKHEYPFVNVRDNDNNYASNIYGIKETPANYLFNNKNELVGKNLFGQYLEEKLQKLFNE